MQANKRLPEHLPALLKVGPIEYRVSTQPNLTQDGNSLFGRVSFRDNEIVIDEGLSTAMKWQCLFHEAVHIFFEQLGIEDPSEGQIDALAYKLLDFILSNECFVIVFPALETPVKGFSSFDFMNGTLNVHTDGR